VSFSRRRPTCTRLRDAFTALYTLDGRFVVARAIIEGGATRKGNNNPTREEWRTTCLRN
jgi:hypothetical protein